MLVRAVMPIATANKLTKIDLTASEEEEKSIPDNVVDKVETATGAADKALEIMSGMPEIPKDVAEFMPNFMTSAYGSVKGFFGAGADTIGDTVQAVTGPAGNAIKIYKAFKQVYESGKLIYQNRSANLEAGEAAERDKTLVARIEGEEGARSESEKKRREASIARNKLSAELGQGMGTKRKVDEIINETASLVGEVAKDASGTELPIAAIVEEAGHFINFMRNYFEDKASVSKYFDSVSEAAKLKKAIKEKAGLQLNEYQQKEIDSLKDNEMMRRGMGYENYTEMASVVGLSVTRSLLFSVGKQGGMEEARVRALAVLVMLDCKDLVGKHDSASAERLYDAIMGSDYR
jgi:hypothetical protein